eukprot:CAMPEP_0202453896 /NCGR_PEP_ID=MMETSP1360-20130828/11766_1 /ASSEMBLY_ACC=CAM_ASM_000848 /TAXON_ID=515479 /ORGANISM="Licmophora paradoxa, Strain CCMP2313" /LENGTH=66 /DNA_ID=CAMNT_0049073095 /DNA_START=769 /DNA_END=969 /DNA_ORIENTATION=-
MPSWANSYDELLIQEPEIDELTEPLGLETPSQDVGPRDDIDYGLDELCNMKVYLDTGTELKLEKCS